MRKNEQPTKTENISGRWWSRTAFDLEAELEKQGATEGLEEHSRQQGWRPGIWKVLLMLEGPPQGHQHGGVQIMGLSMPRRRLGKGAGPGLSGTWAGPARGHGINVSTREGISAGEYVTQSILWVILL